MMQPQQSDSAVTNTYTLVFKVLFLLLAPCVLCYIFPVLSWIRWLWQRYVLSTVDYGQLPGLKLPPGTMGYPLIGETVHFLRMGSTFYQKKMEEYGQVYKTHLLGSPTIRVIGAENVKKILLGENSIVTHNWPSSTRLLLGNGSITQSAGFTHKVRRKHMMHAFGFRSLDNMVPVIRDSIRSSMHEWPNRGDVFVYSECRLLTFAVAARSLIGMDIQRSRNSEMEKTFYDFLENLMTLPFDVPGFGFRKGMKAKHRLFGYLREVFRDLENGPHTPVMKAYYDSCAQLDDNTEEDTLEGVIDLLFAGHETIASTTTNCVMFLGQNGHVLTRLRQEIEDTIQEHGDGDDLDFQAINSMDFLNCVVKEVLRLCPPAGAGFRKALKSFELGGFLIPKDWAVIFSIRETQHTSPLFENSEQFKPERWETINQEDARFHYLPFGMGARSCVGKMHAMLVVKIFLIELVRCCDWRLLSEKITMKYIPVPVATDHLPATFTRRAEAVH